MVSYSQAVKNFYRNAYNYSGRATRAEYWWNVLQLIFLCVLIYFYVDVRKLYGIGEELRPDLSESELWRGYIGIYIHTLPIIFIVSLIFPVSCLFVRRLHDIGLSGWIALIVGGFYYFSKETALIGVVIQFILMLLPGQKKDNKYGVNPYTKNETKKEITEE